MANFLAFEQGASGAETIRRLGRFFQYCLTHPTGSFREHVHPGEPR